MVRKHNKVLLLAGALLLAGCTGATVIDDQEGQSGQGKDRWRMEFDKETGKPTAIDVDLGRDKGSVRLFVESDLLGTIEYEAFDATGVTQAAIRAEVEAFSIEHQGRAVEDLIPELQGLITRMMLTGGL